ncbi:MAG: carbohydrate-binding family 9-like protein [Bacteroidota bacterium]|nr:carbohydrate-binding family 9-like protein [Bacteroidota bacterium]MDP4211401.1 carbohydrate-binding family 9-like protein [Bacteroidota bacterium]MDP4248628.1 carbohydrate-binding family 9-like protein [Bacteroidota bacterium]
MNFSVRRVRLLGMLIILGMHIQGGSLYSQKIAFSTDPLKVSKCSDFTLSGDGSNPEWGKTVWHPLTRLDSAGLNYATRFKILYSAKGIYVLFDGEDNRITTSFDQDFQDLFKADVFEVFFHPDTAMPLYLEYEVNALNKELVLLVPNLNGRASGWLPWHYENGRQVKKMVHITGGKAGMNAPIKSWSVELFFPYGIFSPLQNVPPASGTVWRANFYRLDYDSGSMVKWSWAPIEHSFHEFRKFGSIVFE